MSRTVLSSFQRKPPTSSDTRPITISTTPRTFFAVMLEPAAIDGPIRERLSMRSSAAASIDASPAEHDVTRRAKRHAGEMVKRQQPIPCMRIVILQRELHRGLIPQCDRPDVEFTHDSQRR